MNKIYALKDPISDDIRYIGETKNDLKKRLYEHCTIRNLKEKNHKNNWILSIIFQVTTKFQTENIKQKVGISKIDKKIRS